MLILPPRIGKENLKFSEFKSMVLLGANGSGKTRLSVWIEKNNPKLSVHRISAQKSLNMPDDVSPKSKEKAEEEYLYGTSNENKDWLKLDGKINSRWNQSPNTFLLNDFQSLMTLLHTEEYEVSVEFKDSFEEGVKLTKPTTKLDLVKKIWEEVLPHRKLKKKAGKIETYPTNKPDEIYSTSEMSDGERLIFYFIGAILCAPPESIVIIDEPENHLNKSLIKRLWDKIESSRADCSFIFLTHDIDFAISRNGAELIWIKSYEGNETWDYDAIDDIENIPYQVYLEILGSRNPILFIEGTKDSHDYYIYQQLFQNYMIIPIGSCEKVISSTKAFNENTSFHNLVAKGIIDRDRKTEEELSKYQKKDIFVPEVAEIENMFIIEDVIKIIAKIQRKKPFEVFNEVQQKVIKLFSDNLKSQVYDYVIYKIKTNTLEALNEKFDTFETFNTQFKEIVESSDNEAIYKSINSKFEEYISNKDYKSIIKVFNFKGLVAQSRVAENCGIQYKNYITLVKDILKEESNEGSDLRNAMKSYIKIEQV